MDTNIQNKMMLSPNPKMNGEPMVKGDVTPKNSREKNENGLITPKSNHLLSPNEDNFLEPRRPSSIRKPQKRIRSPNLEGECSPGEETFHKFIVFCSFSMIFVYVLYLIYGDVQNCKRNLIRV